MIALSYWHQCLPMGLDDSAIARNISAVKAQIAHAAESAGRNSDAVQLIAVSKTQPWPAVAAALAVGQHHFGENTVQDALKKIPAAQATAAQWHFIGHLQSNKARAAAQHFGWVHSLDSVALASKLARAREPSAAPLNVLIEVNVTNDPNKHGVHPATLPVMIENILDARLPQLRLRGLMAIGPQTTDEKELRSCFAQLRNLRDAQAARFGLAEFTELSMGMSGDFVPAIQEGATFVRIGTAIFGTRLVKA